MEPRIANDYPCQPVTTAQERAHPRYPEYCKYRSAIANQLATADTFPRWLKQVTDEENGRSIVYEVASPLARLARGWYKNVFPAGSNGLHYTYGPFATEAEAESATD